MLLDLGLAQQRQDFPQNVRSAFKNVFHSLCSHLATPLFGVSFILKVSSSHFYSILTN